MKHHTLWIKHRSPHTYMSLLYIKAFLVIYVTMRWVIFVCKQQSWTNQNILRMVTIVCEHISKTDFMISKKWSFCFTAVYCVYVCFHFAPLYINKHWIIFVTIQVLHNQNGKSYLFRRMKLLSMEIHWI